VSDVFGINANRLPLNFVKASGGSYTYYKVALKEATKLRKLVQEELAQ
jgi:hypothetical protein